MGLCLPLLGIQRFLDHYAARFIKVANETMSRPIRTLTEARGHASSKHMYAPFSSFRSSRIKYTFPDSRVSEVQVDSTLAKSLDCLESSEF
jgi:hypothetical protein